MFRDNLQKLIGLFVLFSVLVTPQILAYSRGGGYGPIHNSEYLEKFSLGNLGYTSVKCQ